MLVADIRSYTGLSTRPFPATRVYWEPSQPAGGARCVVLSLLGPNCMRIALVVASAACAAAAASEMEVGEERERGGGGHSLF